MTVFSVVVGTSLFQKLGPTFFPRLNLHVFSVRQKSQLENVFVDILLLDKELKTLQAIQDWKHQYPNCLIICSEGDVESDLWVPEDWPRIALEKTLKVATKELKHKTRIEQLEQNVALSKSQLRQVNQIGIALSAEKNLQRLLNLILEQGRKLLCCDAASLYLIDYQENRQRKLNFKLAQNGSVECPFEEHSLQLDKTSIAGYAVLEDKELNIANVYAINDSYPFQFNKTFDSRIGYRTISMLTAPMYNYNHRVVGVLQMINKKKEQDAFLTSPELAQKWVVEFSDNDLQLLRYLASQAAVAIENADLIEKTNNLFEGFVNASVTAIEQRDPTTSGHSFRVAELTTNLAIMTSRSSCERFKNISFDEKKLRELRYASLLHDFGKVGVRERVLVKSKKLSESQVEIIQYRIALEKERIKNNWLSNRVNKLYDQDLVALSAQVAAIGSEQELQRALDNLDNIEAIILAANEPTVLPHGASQDLEKAYLSPCATVGGFSSTIINRDEFLSLSVRKGSLTDEERKEIQSHVVHTYNFLKLIPWTEELSAVPIIAAAHHERADGSGYPLGLGAQDIPLESKIMSVCDVYDALTAADRPYKSAVSNEKALDILSDEAKTGGLDRDIVQIFIESKTYDCIDEVGSSIFRGQHFDRESLQNSINGLHSSH